MNCSIETDADGHEKIYCVTSSIPISIPGGIVTVIVIAIILSFITCFSQVIPAARNYLDYGHFRVPRYTREGLGMRDYQEL